MEMKRFFSVMLCALALATLGFGNAKAEVVYGSATQEQKSEINYDIYVGQYQVAEGFVLTVTNENGKLMGQPTGDEKAEFKPKSGADEFYSSTVNASLKFARDAAGVVTAVVVNIDGKDFYSKKIK
jgi:hypothetical protein